MSNEMDDTMIKCPKCSEVFQDQRLVNALQAMKRAEEQVQVIINKPKPQPVSLPADKEAICCLTGKVAELEKKLNETEKILDEWKQSVADLTAECNRYKDANDRIAGVIAEMHNITVDGCVDAVEFEKLLGKFVQV